MLLYMTFSRRMPNSIGHQAVKKISTKQSPYNHRICLWPITTQVRSEYHRRCRRFKPRLRRCHFASLQGRIRRAIAHASRPLLPAEKNYSQIKKEGFALVFAVQTFHKLLHGRRFTLLTDHKPLASIFGSKKRISVYTANRLQRWATTLSAYDFNIQYKSITSFGQSDALSRLIATNSTRDEDRVIAAIAVDADITLVFTSAARALPVTANEIRDSTSKDRLSS